MYWLMGGLATVFVLVVILLCYQNFSVPELGVKNGQFKQLADKPNGVSTQAKNETKRVAPIPFNGDLGSVMKEVEKIVSGMPEATLKEISEGYLYAVFSSATLGFRDDVEVFIDEPGGHIHFRSASRSGYSDLGVNRKRYHSFANRFNQGLLVKN